MNNGAIREVNLKTGTITTLAGTGNVGYSGDGGAPSSALLGNPAGIAVDSAGNLFTSDAQDNVIREVSTPSNLARTVAVAQAPLTITANNATKTTGGAVPGLTYTITGLVNGDTAAKLSAPPTLSTTATASSAAGTYPITVSGATAPDYAIHFVDGTLTVTPPRVVSVTSEPAAVQGITKARIGSGRHMTPRAILVQFNGAIDGSAAQNLGNYHLTTRPRGRKNGKPLALSSASYDPTAQAVTILTRNKLAAHTALELTVNAAGLGLAGGNTVASLET